MGDSVAPELYDGAFWARLLTRLDDEGTEPLRLVVIGGAAIGLQHLRAFQTRDVDTISAIPAAAQAALDRVGSSCSTRMVLRAFCRASSASRSGPLAR